mmetsp:Transcript_19009/g.67124  ORF Transcript_19009/g.67124 Transcript_19009/m.67124 type:complete len:421 (-) Transcript_19009:473-1735(-)
MDGDRASRARGSAAAAGEGARAARAQGVGLPAHAQQPDVALGLRLAGGVLRRGKGRADARVAGGALGHLHGLRDAASDGGDGGAQDAVPAAPAQLGRAVPDPGAGARGDGHVAGGVDAGAAVHGEGRAVAPRVRAPLRHPLGLPHDQRAVEREHRHPEPRLPRGPLPRRGRGLLAAPVPAVRLRGRRAVRVPRRWPCSNAVQAGAPARAALAVGGHERDLGGALRRHGRARDLHLRELGRVLRDGVRVRHHLRPRFSRLPLSERQELDVARAHGPDVRALRVARRAPAQHDVHRQLHAHHGRRQRHVPHRAVGHRRAVRDAGGLLGGVDHAQGARAQALPRRRVHRAAQPRARHGALRRPAAAARRTHGPRRRQGGGRRAGRRVGNEQHGRRRRRRHRRQRQRRARRGGRGGRHRGEGRL